MKDDGFRMNRAWYVQGYVMMAVDVVLGVIAAFTLSVPWGLIVAAVMGYYVAMILSTLSKNGWWA